MLKSFIKSGLILLLGLIMCSCGGSSIKIDPNLSPEEKEAVVKTEKSLPHGDKMVNYTIVKSTLPLALLDQEYKNMRDQVFKYRLDYINCMKRGLEAPAQKNLENLAQIQNIILEKSAALESASPQYIFVLAEVKERTRRDGKVSAFIAIYDSSTLQQTDLIQITTPIFKNAEMVTEALDGTLANPETFSNNPSELNSSNPIVNFILHSNPK